MSGDRRVSSLAGDRMCLGCGYNLVGQPVVRERHYEMLIVRCPECGTVASLQEHPLLGRWAGRWATLLAALWFLAVIGLAMGTSGILFSFASSTARRAIVPYATFLAERQLDYFKEQQASGTLPINWQYAVDQQATPYMQCDLTWWSQQDPEALWVEAGGWGGGGINWSALRQWVGMTLMCVPIGVFWAVALLHWRMRLLAVGGLLLVTLAAALLLTERFGSVTWLIAWEPVIEVAMKQRGYPIVGLTLVYAALPLMVAMVLGRPIIRLVLRLLLSPRLRAPLAILWITDGLEPPGVSSSSSKPSS